MNPRRRNRRMVGGPLVAILVSSARPTPSRLSCRVTSVAPYCGAHLRLRFMQVTGSMPGECRWLRLRRRTERRHSRYWCLCQMVERFRLWPIETSYVVGAAFDSTTRACKLKLFRELIGASIELCVFVQRLRSDSCASCDKFVRYAISWPRNLGCKTAICDGQELRLHKFWRRQLPS